jgi:PAS domain-containing protein
MEMLERNEAQASDCHKWLEATVESIADAVIATDITGAITAMNAAAERLTGWKLDDARFKPIGEVMVICRRSTGEQLECGEPTLISELTEAALAPFDEHCRGVLRAAEVKSYICVPLTRNAESIGGPSFSSAPVVGSTRAT